MVREENLETGDLNQGTLEIPILRAPQRGSMHGYGVAEWLHQTSQQALKLEEGALYPALHRLERRGMLFASCVVSENDRCAKFYQLTV
jgi:PadR family transcriptional regulator, regulatory protein PadR